MTPELLPRKSKRKEKHTQGPLDELTASSITMLPGHTTEVRNAVLSRLPLFKNVYRCSCVLGIQRIMRRLPVG